MHSGRKKIINFALRYPVRSFLLCGKKRDGQTDKQTNRWTDFLILKNVTDKRTNGQTDKQTDKQTDRPTDRLLTDIII